MIDNHNLFLRLLTALLGNEYDASVADDGTITVHLTLIHYGVRFPAQARFPNTDAGLRNLADFAVSVRGTPCHDLTPPVEPCSQRPCPGAAPLEEPIPGPWADLPKRVRMANPTPLPTHKPRPTMAEALSDLAKALEHVGGTGLFDRLANSASAGVSTVEDFCDAVEELMKGGKL